MPSSLCVAAASAFFLLTVCLAGCATSTPALPTAASTTQPTVDLSGFTVAFTADDEATCGEPATADSAATDLLALPQSLARLGMPAEDVRSQFDGWESLSVEDRQFQLCLNAAEGEFE